MNDLNSIIITGQVNTITKPDNCVLWINIHRNKKERDVILHKILRVPVYIMGDNLLKSCESLKNGDQVRVVGTIEEKDDGLYIAAETVEVAISHQYRRCGL